MSWWVMEQVSVNDDGTQSLVNIQCDDVSDLPSPNQTATAGYTIVRGSQAKVLATSENYILGGSGTWVKMEDGVKLDLAGYATEQYVNDGLADKVDTLVYSSGQAAQDAEISSLLDRNAKNIFNTTVIPQTATRNGVTIERTEKGLHISGTVSSTADTQIASFAIEIPGDDYHIHISTDASALNVWCSYRKYGASSDTYAPAVRDTLNTGDVLKYLYFKNLPSGTTFDSDVDIMICTAADYDISNQFVPYAPTNRELYEMILALQ